MSGLPAARVGDMHVCPMVTPGVPPIPHVGGPILPPCAPTVIVGGMPQARITDLCVCVGPPDSIVKGSFVVPAMNNPAARMTDQTAHGGTIVIGFPTVLIGLAGTAGNPPVGTAMCNAAAGGRTSGATSQTYNNCGVESSRQVINQANGTAVTENGLLTSAINSGQANGTPGTAPVFADGGTGAAGRQQILANNGVASTVETSNHDSLGLAASRGNGTIANLDAAVLWGAPTPPGSLHAVTVTGVQYD
ncbi:MAG: PAAR domain-containing protein, partial [Burkholderiaceae bacterium]|nr:PAAR domain-containing protein [Burkholderiaceae bacterium]